MRSHSLHTLSRSLYSVVPTLVKRVTAREVGEDSRTTDGTAVGLYCVGMDGVEKHNERLEPHDPFLSLAIISPLPIEGIRRTHRTPILGYVAILGVVIKISRNYVCYKTNPNDGALSLLRAAACKIERDAVSLVKRRSADVSSTRV